MFLLAILHKFEYLLSHTRYDQKVKEQKNRIFLKKVARESIKSTIILTVLDSLRKINRNGLVQ